MIKKNGFTLIELLVVIVIIGVLTAVLIQVINPKRAQGAARDGVRMANMEKLAQALEAYGAAEGKYPVAADFGGTTTPDTNSMSPTLKEYVKNWPEKDIDDDAYKYRFYQILSTKNFVLFVRTERGTASCLKYGSETGKIIHCKDKCTTDFRALDCTQYD